MPRKTLVLILIALLAVVAIAAPATANKIKPTTIGEHVTKSIETAHPYQGSGEAAPTLSWNSEIHHPGATYIAVHFAKFQLAPGDYAVVRSADGLQKWVYEDLGRHNRGLNPNGFFATHIKGDRAIIELYTKGENEGAAPAYGFSIDRYGRGYNNTEIEQFWLDGKGKEMNLPYPSGWGESICTADDTEEAKCYENSEPAAYDQARAVARLLLNGAAHCTGWLIGSEGHMMTNEHCITSQAQTDDIDFEFMAEGATCATNCGSSLACGGIVEASGGTFVTDDGALDYALVIPDTSTGTGTDLAATYGFMRLRQSGAVLNERIYIVQHPAGWGKRFAMQSSYPDDMALGGFAYVNSITEAACSGGTNDVGYWADTQGGSSGSPVLGYSDNRVVALHHCRGSAFCTSGNSGTDDPNRGVPIQDVITSLGANLPNGAVCDPPTVPTNLSATANGDNRIDLSWTASTPTEGNEITYDVYRAIGSCPGGDYELIASGVSGTTYSDTSASADVAYSYQVGGYIAATECSSSRSNCDSASTTGLCTEPPTFAGITDASNNGTAMCGVTVSWDNASAFCSPTEGASVVYSVYRSETAEGGMAPVATCLTGNSWVDSAAEFGTSYTYEVRAEDQSGNGSGPCAGGNEDSNTASASAIATGPDAVSFLDDVEAGGTNFTAATGPNDGGGTSPWSIIDTASNSPIHSWFVVDEATVKDQVIEMASMSIGTGAVLEFWHNVDTESTFDGGVLEYSTDGGTTWLDIDPMRFIEGGYNAVLSTSFGNPLPGRDAWSGSTGGWVRVAVDLADFSGQNVRFRWRFGCDQSVSGEGWWVDDVRIFAGTMCSTTDIFMSDFEGGDVSDWSNSFP